MGSGWRSGWGRSSPDQPPQTDSGDDPTAGARRTRTPTGIRDSKTAVQTVAPLPEHAPSSSPQLLTPHPAPRSTFPRAPPPTPASTPLAARVLALPAYSPSSTSPHSLPFPAPSPLPPTLSSPFPSPTPAVFPPDRHLPASTRGEPTPGRPCLGLPHRRSAVPLPLPRSPPPAGRPSPLLLPRRLFLSPPREVSGLSVSQSFGPSAPKLRAAGAIASRAVRDRRQGRRGPVSSGETRPPLRQVPAPEAPSGRQLRPLPPPCRPSPRHLVKARPAQVTAPGWGRTEGGWERWRGKKAPRRGAGWRGRTWGSRVVTRSDGRGAGGEGRRWGQGRGGGRVTPVGKG